MRCFYSEVVGVAKRDIIDICVVLLLHGVWNHIYERSSIASIITASYTLV